MRLIDADALKKKAVMCPTVGNAETLLLDISDVENAPTIEEHKTGKWVHGRELWREHVGDVLIGIGYEDWRCSECNTLVKDNATSILWRYCPWCGAKMEGVK